MPKVFGLNNMNLGPGAERQALQTKYNSARVNLLMAVAFTVVNMLLLAFGGNTYFLFSITVPYVIPTVGMLLCGMLPEEIYADPSFDGMVFLDEGFFYITLAISLLILALYVACWFFSKKKSVWLKVALGLFIVDTLFMIFYYGLAVDMIMDVLFHGYVIYILISGIIADKKLKAMPKEEPIIEAEFTDVSEENAESKNSAILRSADTMEKVRVLLDAEVNGHSIVYRRIKRTNELVIDGNVYDEYIALAEYPHQLTASINGHIYCAGMDQTSHCYIMVDGETVKTKLRLI